MAKSELCFASGLQMHFDARVSGIPDYCNLVRSQLGRDEARYQIRKMRVARDEIVRLLGSANKSHINEIFRRKAKTKSHLFFERESLLKPLQGWLARHLADMGPSSAGNIKGVGGTLTTSSDAALRTTSTSQSSQVLKTIQATSTASSASIPTLPPKVGCRTLESLGLNDALIVPLDLPKPLSLDLSMRAYRLPVVSASALIKELDFLEARLATAKTFGVPKVGNFLFAKACDVERLARLEGLNDRFWVRFSAVILRHLATSALEHDLCAHITDRPLAPVV